MESEDGRAEPVPRSGGFFLPLALLAALIGAAASSALLADYTRKAAVYCAEDGGCAKVRAWASMMGVPFPAIGVAAFSALAILTLLRGKNVRILHAIFATAAATGALFLLGLQAFFIHAFCTYCVVVDVVAILAAPLAIARFVRAADLQAPRLRSLASPAIVLAAVGPVGVGLARPPRAPKAIQALEATAPAHTLSVVVFTDFECPYCRALHPKLAAAIAPFPGEVRVFRIDKPLKMHPHARDAARAHICSRASQETGPEMQGVDPHADPQAERFAERLFATDDRALTTPNFVKIAGEILPADAQPAFLTCLTAPATEEKLVQDADFFTQAGGFALPLVFVGRVRFEGDADEAELARAVQDELRAVRQN